MSDYMVMTDAHNRTCLRVEVGPKFTWFISRDKKNVDLRKLSNEQFDQLYIWEWPDHTPARCAATMISVSKYGVMVTRRASAHLNFLISQEPSMATPTPTPAKLAKDAAATPVKAPKAPKAPSTEGTEGAEASRRGKRIENQKIRQLVKENPKRPSSNAFQIFSLYATCKTTDEFFAAGGNSAALRYDIEHEFIELY